MSIHLGRTVNQKLRLLELCQKLTAEVYGRRCCILESYYFTCDKILLHHYTPKSKQASIKCRRKGEAASVKTRLNCQLARFFQQFFFYRWGILLIEILYEQARINVPSYCELLSEERVAYHHKRRHQPIRKVIFLHNNARPNTAALMVSKLEGMHWT